MTETSRGERQNIVCTRGWNSEPIAGRQFVGQLCTKSSSLGGKKGEKSSDKTETEARSLLLKFVSVSEIDVKLMLLRALIVPAGLGGRGG